MAVRGSFVLFVSLVFFSFNANNIVVSSLTHDQKVDMITEAYNSLRYVVQSLIDVQTAIQEGASTTESDISTLDDSKSRSEYEVNVMKVEHQMMLAEASKRQDVSPEEQASADDRGKAIDAAEEKVVALGATIAETKTKVDDLNEQMSTTTLSADSLKALQDKANEGVENPDDHITLPSTEDIKTKAAEQLANMQTVITTVTDTIVKKVAQELKNTIDTKLNAALDGQSNFAKLTVQCKEIDVSLLQFRNLDLYGSAAKMEL